MCEGVVEIEKIKKPIQLGIILEMVLFDLI